MAFAGADAEQVAAAVREDSVEIDVATLPLMPQAPLRPPGATTDEAGPAEADPPQGGRPSPPLRSGT